MNVPDNTTFGNVRICMLKGEKGDGVEAMESAIETERNERVAADDALRSAIGTPLKASTAAQMTNTSKIYVYTGSESGYTAGHWYYYTGSVWADGGVYNSTAFETDKTLAVADMAADAKETGDQITDLKSALSESTLNLIGELTLQNGYVHQGLTYGVQNGVVSVKGTGTVAGVVVISNPITLPAGTYKFGSRAGMSGVSLQLRKWENGADAGGISQTSGFITVTIEDETTVIVRISHNNTSVSTTVYPELVLDNGYDEFIPGVVAFDGIARYLQNKLSHYQILPSSDLNDAVSPGIYHIPIGLECENCPVSSTYNRMLFVDSENSEQNCIQELHQYNTTYTVYSVWRRMRPNSSIGFYAWNKVYDSGSLNNALKVYGYIDNNTDLDTLIESAVYMILPNRMLINAPDDYAGSSSVLVLLPTVSGSTVASIVQVYINYTKATIHYRIKSHGSSTWADWKNQSAGYKELGYLPTNTDLDTLIDQGYWVILSNRVLTNAPDNYENSSSMISVNPSLSGSLYGQVYQYYYNWSKQTTHMRSRPANSSTWTEWRLLEHGIANESEIGKILDYRDYSNDSITENIGVTLDLLIYNVAHYNRDRGQPGILPSLYKEKLSNLKKLLQYANADVLFITEEAQYVNEDETKTASNYLYRPVYPKTIADTETNIRTKQNLTNTGTYNLTSAGRVLRYGTLTVDETDILLVCVHFTTSDAESRLRDLQETIAFCKSQNISHYIIAGDLNTLTEDDRTNLETTCISENIEYANGGYLGWVETHWQKYPLDNLLCSQNIIINRFESLNNWFNSLYSDHYPVRANVTIL